MYFLSSLVLTGKITYGILIRTESVSSLKEDETREVDSDFDDSDNDYMSCICVW